jgi:hypothetical protein
VQFLNLFFVVPIFTQSPLETMPHELRAMLRDRALAKHPHLKAQMHAVILLQISPFLSLKHNVMTIKVKLR